MAEAEELGGGIALVVVVGLGWALYSDHQEKTKTAVDAAVHVQLEAKAKADAANTAKRDEETAITLAKEAHTLAGEWPIARKADSEILTNDYQVRQRVSRMKGELKLLGWQARKFDDDTYVVSFSYEHGGESRGWPFEVNVRAKVVRAIVGDAELEKKYGWGNR